VKIIVAVLLLTLVSLIEAARAAPGVDVIKSGQQVTGAERTDLRSNQVWSMHQKGLVLGEFDVLVSKIGLRASCRRSGITFVARPPRWQVIGFSQRSNAVWCPRQAQFDPTAALLKSFSITGLPYIAKIPLIQNGRKTVVGLNCKNFVTSAGWTSEQARELEQKNISNTFMACRILAYSPFITITSLLITV